MSPPIHENALDVLERARRAQELHDRRIDVQLRLGLQESAGRADSAACLPAPNHATEQKEDTT